MEETKEIVSVNESALGRIVITEAQVELIKKTVALGATDDELKLFFYECRRRGVHPLDRLIHFVKRGQGDDRKATFQAGIDFMRSQAEATGEYWGQDDIEYGPMIDITYEDKTIKVPSLAKATVRRRNKDIGEIASTSSTAYWDEYYPGGKLGFKWRSMPRVMLGKCAESLAIRKAFPRQLSGLYSFEEMEQADIIEHPPIQEPQKKTGDKVSESLTVTAAIETIEIKTGMKKGKDGGKDQPWTLYIVHTATEKYNTFSDTFGALAKRAVDEKLNAVITWSETPKGKKLENIVLEEPSLPESEEQ